MGRSPPAGLPSRARSALFVVGLVALSALMYYALAGRPGGDAGAPWAQGERLRPEPSLAPVRRQPDESTLDRVLEAWPPLHRLVHGDEPKLFYVGWGGPLQVISAYECEESHPGCQEKGDLCLMMRNTGPLDIPLSSLGRATVMYELPEAPAFGRWQLDPRRIGVRLDATGPQVCCTLDELERTGGCAGVESIDVRKAYIMSFRGEFALVPPGSGPVDPDGPGATWLPLSYNETKDHRLIFRVYVPGEYPLQVDHQVV